MSINKKLVITILLIIIGITGRLMPHVWNTTPVTAIALFATAYLGLEYSVFITFLVMIISDSAIGFYHLPVLFTVYLSLIAASCIGNVLKKKKSAGLILLNTVTASLLFFITTNFAVWQFSTLYEHTFSGLMLCYTLALPFFKNSLVGDIIYTGLFFGVYEFAQAKISTKILNFSKPVRQAETDA